MHDLEEVVVIGAGLTGLAVALAIKQTDSKEKKLRNVTLLEKRSGHTREHFILLNHLSACRLKELGVYDVWKQNIQEKQQHDESQVIYYDQVHLKGNISAMIAGMKQNGMLVPNAPDDVAQFGCLQSLKEICEKCHQTDIPIDAETGMVLDFSAIPPETVVQLHDQGTGIQFAQIKELETAMARVAQEIGVQLVYDCGEIELVKSPLADTVQEIRYGGADGNSIIVSNPSLVVMCEGARRQITKEQLGAKEHRSSISQWYIFLQVNKYYGPDLFLVINEQDEDYPGKMFRHFACGGIQDQQRSFMYLQIPDELRASRSDDIGKDEINDAAALQAFCWKHIGFFTRRHGLELPETIELIGSPFESRETYLETCCFGKNVVVVGDAARAGSFQSGASYNLVLVNDLNVIHKLLSALSTQQSLDEQVITACNAAILHTSKHLFKINLERYY